MSLIDEALKRAQAADSGRADGQSQRPWIPTPMPDAGPARRRRVVSVLGIVLCLLAVGVGSLLLVRRRPAETRALRRGEDGAGERVSSRTPPPTLVPPAGQAPESTSAAGPPRVTPRLGPAQTQPGGAAAETSARAPASAPHAETLSDGRTYVRSVGLPGGAKIELGGIVYSETQSVALLNDRVRRVGDQIEGFEVVRIDEDRVELAQDDLTIFIALK